MKKSLFNYSMKGIARLILVFVFMLGLLPNAKAGGGKPYMELIGADTVHLVTCSYWTDPGITVYDSLGHVINGAQYTRKPVTFAPVIAKIGFNYLTYYFTDSLGKKADTIIRVISVAPDTIKPILTLHGDDTVRMEAGHAYIDSGAKAIDSLCDGNITSKIKVTYTPILDNMVPGTYLIKYDVKDNTGNSAAQVMRVVIVGPDVTAPNLIVQGPEYDTITVGSSYTSPSAVLAEDMVDGDLLSNVQVIGTVNPNVPGTYTLTYKVSDYSGNLAYVYRYVCVKDYSLDIYGSVKAGTSPGSSRAAKVWLIKFDLTDSTLTAEDSVTFSAGNGPNFHFTNVAKGNYLIKAALDSTDSLYASYLPTYYGGQAMWYNATSVSISYMDISALQINLIAGTNPGGPGFIAGHVTQGANKKEGDPIQGQVILLTTMDDKPLRYTVSDENGYYEFTGLPYGSYKVVGETSGKKSIGGAVTLDATNPGSQNVELIVKSTEIQTVIYVVKCSAKFTYGKNGGKVSFLGDKTVNQNLRYYWNFGDGNTATGYSVTHQYSVDGLYHVCLEVKDSVKNCSDKYCDYVVVDIPILSITGTVSADGITNSVATVWLMKHNNVTDGYDAAASQQIFLDNTASAYYQFDKLQPGEYLVKAYMGKTSPQYRNAVPTYYPQDLKWKNATTVGLSTVPKTDVDINFLKVQDIQGKGVVSGHIRVGALKKEGDPIEDIAVLLLSESGDPVSFDITDANGAYSISNIPNGKYEVYAEVSGMETYSRWIEITDDAFTFTEVNFSVQSTNIVTSIEDIPASVENLSLFPNPANTVLNLQLNMVKTQQVRVTVVDMTGRVVITKDQLLTAGKQTIQFDLSALKAGAYTVNVQDASGRVVHGNFIRIE